MCLLDKATPSKIWITVIRRQEFGCNVILRRARAAMAVSDGYLAIIASQFMCTLHIIHYTFKLDI